MKYYLGMLFLTLVLTGCTTNDDPVKIRLGNTSKFNFYNVVVNTSSQEVGFGSLDAGSSSEYKEFERAYRYAYVEVEVDGETYELTPTDYVGETPLDPGNYTYLLNLTEMEPDTYELSLQLQED